MITREPHVYFGEAFNGETWFAKHSRMGRPLPPDWHRKKRAARAAEKGRSERALTPPR